MKRSRIFCAFLLFLANVTYAADPQSHAQAEHILRLMADFHKNSRELKDIACARLALEQPSTAVDCLAEFDHFCHELHSSQHNGRKVFPSGREIAVGNGKHGYEDAGINAYRADLEGRHNPIMPHDLRLDLESNGYYQKLSEFLSKTNAQEFSLEDRVRLSHLRREMDAVGVVSSETTALRRNVRRFGDVRIFLEPPHYLSEAFENEKVKALVEFFTARWENDPGWRKARATAESLRDSALEVLEQKTDLDSATKDRLRENLRTMKFESPGSHDSHSGDCATKEVNAAYNLGRNSITICAGAFGSSNMEWMIAHEIGHAMGFGRSERQAVAASEFMKRYTHIRARSCANAPIRCEEWQDFKKDSGLRLKELQASIPQPGPLEKCLIKRNKISAPDPKEVERKIRNQVESRVDSMAEKMQPLYFTLKEIPLKSGGTYSNPNYLNSCEYYREEKPDNNFHASEALAEFFIHEYRCGNSGVPNAERMKTAIESAKTLFAEMTATYHIYDGYWSVSGSQHMQKIEEQSADTIGGSIYLHHQRKTGGDTDDPIENFFVGQAIFCPAENVLEQAHPAEYKVLHGYSKDYHTPASERLREILSTPMREHLGCEIKEPVEDCLF